MRIGVLALQGAFLEHIHILTTMGVEAFEIRCLQDLKAPIDGFILPGGESSVMAKLLQDFALFEPMKQAFLQGTPVFGTCAGLILLSKQLTNASQPGFQLMDITTKRNAYGRQSASFTTSAKFHEKEIDMVFIRAPSLHTNHQEVTILASVDGKHVAARQNNMLVTAFHPELTKDTYVHTYFLDMVAHA